MISKALAVSLIVIPTLVQAGLFPPKGDVKPLEAKNFKKALQDNRTAVVAFVAPWCGHCQKMTPEYTRAAGRLKPLVNLYAVDCDDEGNKRLCAEQGIRGFPTLKVFKRGGRGPGIEYQGAREANDIYAWAKDSVPNVVKRVRDGTKGIAEWREKFVDNPRTLLITKESKQPLLWTVLGNQFDKKITFGAIRDQEGTLPNDLGFTSDDKKTKVLIYVPGSSEPILYKGVLNYESLSKFFIEFAAGTADLSDFIKPKTKAEEAPSPEPTPEPGVDFQVHDAVVVEQPKTEGEPKEEETKPVKKQRKSKKLVETTSSEEPAPSADSTTSSSETASTTASETVSESTPESTPEKVVEEKPVEKLVEKPVETEELKVAEEPTSSSTSTSTSTSSSTPTTSSSEVIIETPIAESIQKPIETTEPEPAKVEEVKEEKIEKIEEVKKEKVEEKPHISHPEL